MYTERELEIIALSAERLALAMAACLRLEGLAFTEDNAIDEDLYTTCFDLWSSEPEVADHAWSNFWHMVCDVETKATLILENSK